MRAIAIIMILAGGLPPAAEAGIQAKVRISKLDAGGQRQGTKSLLIRSHRKRGVEIAAPGVGAWFKRFAGFGWLRNTSEASVPLPFELRGVYRDKKIVIESSPKVAIGFHELLTYLGIVSDSGWDEHYRLVTESGLISQDAAIAIAQVDTLVEYSWTENVYDDELGPDVLQAVYRLGYIHSPATAVVSVDEQRYEISLTSRLTFLGIPNGY